MRQKQAWRHRCVVVVGVVVWGVLAASSAATFGVDGSNPEGLRPARVVYVYDGDTIDVMLEGRRTRVRYIGIDTPELSDERPHLQALARQALAANKGLVLGKDILIEWDVERHDVYGRALAYVYVDSGTFVNGWLVEQGLARTLTIPPNTKYREALRALELQARLNGRGIWAGGSKPPLEVMASPPSLGP